MRRGPATLILAVALMTVVVTEGQASGTGGSSPTVVGGAAGGPAAANDCTFNLSTDAFTGAYGTASAIGWEGNHQGVVTCLGGTFVVQNGIYHDFGFGIYTGTATTWRLADGYLPAQITTFRRPGVVVSITEFADQLVLGGDAYVAVYSRVAVHNVTSHVVTADPGASAGLVPLGAAADPVPPGATIDHDYVVASDRFGNDYPWPTDSALAGAGTFDQHYAHMAHFWNGQLAGIAQITVPDAALVDAYRSGFIYTQIARSGVDLDTGVNGYESEFSHDTISILTNLFVQGDFTDARALLLEVRNVVGSAGQYNDGLWTYALPWAMYLMKTGDVGFVEQNFATEGPQGTAQPSIEDSAHAIAADRTGTGGIMESTNDLDFQGYWTSDNYGALLGLAAYRYLARRTGNASEAAWATEQYDSLLAATNQTLTATISTYRLTYLPCSMVEPNSANTCAKPEDANWESPLGRWAWDSYLLGAPVNGPGLSMITATYAHGFARLRGHLPPDTFGGFPDRYYYSTAYNAGSGIAGLATQTFRDQGIRGYAFLIANDQSGPYSWWESSTAPSPTTPWIGRHPAAGQGSSPHAWGMSQANNVLLDSLVALRSDGTLIVGRGVPGEWLRHGSLIAVSNFPGSDGQRLSLRITSTGQSVSLTLHPRPNAPVLFQLPAFIENVASSSSGTVDARSGTVTLPPRTGSVTVQLRNPPAAS